MSALTARGKNVKYYICVAISLCFIFLFGKLIQPFAGITPVGISILGIFFGVLIATIVTGETFWPALLGLFGMIVCDFTTAGDLLKTWFGNTTIQQIIWVMALTGAVTESGRGQRAGPQGPQDPGAEGASHASHHRAFPDCFSLRRIGQQPHDHAPAVVSDPGRHL